MRQVLFGLCAALIVGAAGPAMAQSVRVDRITVHSQALDGNLEGNTAERSVTVYLPPDYDSNSQKRYPVLYALHGYSINNDIWSKEIKAPETIDSAYAAGVKGMIVVLPNSQTRHNGSMYSSSATTGDFEGFIATDLVAYIDSHYRTLAQRESRGLAGHSMGGYGTVRIGMKHPEVFSALYAMSPCCLSARGAPSPEEGLKLEALKTPEEAQALGFFVRATLAVSSAWSPNPNKPPFYLDLPTKDGVAQPDVLARWAANAPLSMVHQYIPNMRRYTAIAFDVGDRDGLKTDTEALSAALTTYKVANSFELYDGDHVSGVADRFQNHVLPFFAKHLAFVPVGQ
ncbi:esterase family protein [Asticcacaulis biprosthecium C19]|uniref:Esterase family protein n=1 Tax=Asticcacaulis biprosthecium C19 TaxID=715226 RepID=F4QTD1_9CAUL|nr:alpha/beta hydrolase-fold protein [Asticcacaulis biprosthecium]EGF90001.1 esterase family protein [Asticcacaulis biprosthecium C19]